MPASTLSQLQRDLLEAFFALESRFFLTGGAALAGFHLGHRSTEDLDLFTRESALREGEDVLRRIASDLDAAIEKISSSPYFVRVLLRRGQEGVLVDLVHDTTAQGYPDKLVVGNLRIDPPAEIFANKLCTLLSRAEIRDVVDAMALEETGLDLAGALDLGAKKDGGLTPGQLAWVLSQIEIGDDATIPGGRSAEDIRRYLDDLQARLRRLAFPPRRS